MVPTLKNMHIALWIYIKIKCMTRTIWPNLPVGSMSIRHTHLHTAFIMLQVDVLTNDKKYWFLKNTLNQEMHCCLIMSKFISCKARVYTTIFSTHCAYRKFRHQTFWKWRVLNATLKNNNYFVLVQIFTQHLTHWLPLWFPICFVSGHHVLTYIHSLCTVVVWSICWWVFSSHRSLETHSFRILMVFILPSASCVPHSAAEKPDYF